MNAAPPNPADAPAKVLAIVVAFHPNAARLRELVCVLLEQCDAVEVVDNTPDASTGAGFLSEWADALAPRMSITRFGENRGIGAAQNHGLARVMAEGFDFALLQDQDSIPTPGMVSQLVSIVHSLRAEGVSVGLVSPAYIDVNTGQLAGFQVERPGRLSYALVPGHAADPWVEVATSIASGSLLTREAIQVAGAMRADFFIDQVDIEWCHRARHCGFRLFGTSLARMHHALGEGGFRAWLFGWRACNCYAPDRLYYRFRNFTLLCGLRHVGWGWKLRASVYWLFVFYANVFFANHRGANLQAMLRGILDGLRRRTGPA